MKNLIIFLSLISSVLAHAGQVQSECSAISENRQKLVKVSSENKVLTKKSVISQ